MNDIVKVSILLLLFFLPVNYLEAEETKVVNVGVCLLDSGGDGHSSLAGGVSSILYETVSRVHEYTIGREGLEIFLTREKDKLIREKIKSLENLYNERDLVLFNTGRSKFKTTFDTKTEKIEKAQAELEVLNSERLKMINKLDENTEKVFPLNVLTPDEGVLFKRGPGRISDTAKTCGLDLVIYGLIDSIGDNDYVEIRMWNNLLGKDVFVWRTATGSGDINLLIGPGIKALKTELYGRDWAELTVRGPENCLIYINDKFSGMGSINNLFVIPGTVNIEVRKPGCESFRESFFIEHNTLTERVIELAELEKKTVIIQTWPAGADVYLDSVWCGKSPLRIELQSETSAVDIRKEGFEKRNFFVYYGTDDLFNINLKPESNGRKEWVPEARKRFYTSLGSFMLSMPVTSIFGSMMDQSASAYNRERAENGNENVEELTRLYNLNRAEYGLYLASVGLNIFFFLDTIMQAVDYVSSVEYFSN